MGLFNFFNYSNPGPGVDVNAPPKKAWIRFFELYWRKFSRFIAFNLISFFLMLPIIALLFIVFGGLLLPAAEEGLFASVMLNLLLGLAASIPPSVSALLLLASVVLYGPMKCGLAYIYRNYSREEHAWMSDFWERMRSNFRQGAVLGALELLVISLLILNLLTSAQDDGNIMGSFLPAVKFVSVFLLILVFCARRYVYAMAVTFQLPLRTIVKNAFAFAFMGLWRNIGLAFLDVALIMMLIFIPFADILFMPLFFFSFTGFLSMFATFPLIDKYMLKPALERKKAEEGNREENGAKKD